MSDDECRKIGQMNVEVDSWQIMAIGSPLPRDVKRKKMPASYLDNSRQWKEFWVSELVQRCWHLPPFWVVRGVALNGCPNSLCPNPIHQKPPLHRLTPNLLSISQSICCSLDRRPWVLRWSLVMSLSGEDLKMPANRNRALFIEIANVQVLLSSNFQIFEMAF